LKVTGHRIIFHKLARFYEFATEEESDTAGLAVVESASNAVAIRPKKIPPHPIDTGWGEPWTNFICEGYNKRRTQRVSAGAELILI